MDSKNAYSEEVSRAKEKSAYDYYLEEVIKAGKARSDAYSGGWEEVDLNEVVERFAPDSPPIVRDGKLIFFGETEAVVCDIGGGYLRIQDLTVGTRHPQYLGLNGENMHNYVDEAGKTHGRSRDEYQRVTHFKIKKRG